MKRVIAVAIVVMFVITAFTGCNPVMGLFLPTTQEEAQEAFDLVHGVFNEAFVQIVFFDGVEGVTIDEDNLELIFTDVDLTQFEANETSYTNMSGVYRLSEDGSELFADVRLEGGTVIRLACTASTEEGPVSVLVIANYQRFWVTLVNEPD